MTDLEKHVNQPGRAKLVKKVREKINELGITYIYFQFISVYYWKQQTDTNKDRKRTLKIQLFELQRN